MPANTKYLSSNWQRFAKISAGILGGYLVSTTCHLALASWCNHVIVIISSTFTGFILWVTLMILAFLSKNGWKLWGIYLLLTIFFSIILYLGMLYNPIIS
ncbi:hypothetical protein [Algibacter sp. PT7-4]|uniref:hypothetical protein n=1 Tax=Algibacter ulvanivorans TaxID=3400999 RepID=UPI003AADDE74